MREAVKNAFKEGNLADDWTDYLRYFAKDSAAVRLAALVICVLGPSTAIVLLVWALKRLVL